MAGEELPPAVQDFIANVDDYVGPLEAAIAVAKRFAEANDAAAESALHMAEDLGATAEAVTAAYREMTGASGDYRTSAEATAAAQTAEAAAADDAAQAALRLAAAVKVETDVADAMIAANLAEAAAMDTAAEATQTAAHTRELLAGADAAAADGDRALAGAEAMVGAAADYATAKIEAQIVALTALEAAQRGLMARYMEPVTGAAQDVGALGSEQLTPFSDTDVTRLNAAIADLIGRSRELYTDLDGTITEVKSVGKAALMSAGDLNRVNDSLRDLASAGEPAVSALDDVEAATSKAGAAAKDAGAAVGSSAWSLSGWWQRWGTVIHWVVAGGAEIVATLLPALITLGGAMAAMAPATLDAVHHMQALYQSSVATQYMLSKTGTATSQLGRWFENLSNSMNPDVWALIGAGINATTGKLSLFGSMAQQTGGMIDEFAARIDKDLVGQAGGELTGMLAKGVTDLQEWGQVLGNLGHGLLNFASAMPGLAEVLLKVLDSVTKIFEVVTAHSTILGVPWLTMAMGLEEAWRWGGLVAGRVAALMNLFTTLASKAALAGEAIARMSGSEALEGAAAGVSEAVEGMGTKLAGVAGVLTGPWGWAVMAAAAAVGYLSYKILTGQSAAESFANSLDDVAQKASNEDAINILSSNINTMGIKAQEAAKSSTGFSFSWQNVLHTITSGQDQFVSAGESVEQLNHAMANARQQITNVGTGAAVIMKAYGVDYPEAMGIADAANVKLINGFTGSSEAAQIARQQVANLVLGYQEMGVPAGIMGKDMEALEYSTSQAGSQVSKLNSAWDSFISNVTGGETGFSSFVTDLQNLGGAAAATNVSITGTYSSLKLGASSAKFTLSGFTQQAMQNLQQFNAAVTQSNSVTDWLRTVAATGNLTAGQFKTAVATMVGQLLPFAAKSAAARSELSALAQEASGPASSKLSVLQAWVKKNGGSIKDLKGIIDSATKSTSNLTKQAQDLNTGLGTLVNQGIAKAIYGMSGVQKDIAAYATAVKNSGAESPQATSAAQNLAGALKGIGDTKGEVLNTLQAIGNAAQTEAGQAQPAGKKFYQGLVNGVIQGLPQVRQAYGQVAGAGYQAVIGEQLPGKLRTVGSQSVQGMHDGAQSKTGSVLSLFGTLTQGIHGKLASLAGSLFTIGANAIQGMIGGINSRAAGVLAAVGSIVSSIPSVAMKLLESASPSKVMARIGQQINAGLIQGLEGTASQVKAAVSKLVTDVKMAFNEGLISYGTESWMTKWYEKDNTRLQGLAKERSKILKEIKDAENFATSTKNAIKSDYSIVNAAGTGGAGTATAATMITTLRQDLANVKTFKQNIQKLSKMGLNHAYLRQIIAAGPDQGGPIAAELVAGGWADIKQINSLETQIATAARGLGKSAAETLYDTGKDAGKGFLSGLEAQKKNIEKLMEKIAKDMVKTLKRELGISSPSAVMRPHGQAVVDGLIAGINDRTPALDAAMRKIGLTVRGGPGGTLIPVHTGGGSAAQPIQLQIQVNLDGKQLQSSTQKQTLRYNKRNLSNGLSLAR